jgi:HK97 family phage prohead protease
MRQFKALPYFEIKAASTGRVQKGICAVFGNIDDGGDRIHPGAFKKTISEGRNRVQHLWMHNFGEPPTAKILDLKELSRDELPPEVLEYAPNATGGLLVEREYLNTQRGNELLECLKAGVIKEMSFGYDVVRQEETIEEIAGVKRYIRELKELTLLDTSDVNWGMNPATVAAGAKGLYSIPPLGIVIQQLEFYQNEIKAGRRNNSGDQSLIKR